MKNPQEASPPPFDPQAAEELHQMSDRLSEGLTPVPLDASDSYFSQEASDRAQRLLETRKEDELATNYIKRVAGEKGQKYREMQRAQHPTMLDPETGQEVLNPHHTPRRARKTRKVNLQSWDGSDIKSTREIKAMGQRAKEENHRLAIEEASIINPDAFSEPASEQDIAA